MRESGFNFGPEPGCEFGSDPVKVKFKVKGKVGVGIQISGPGRGRGQSQVRCTCRVDCRVSDAAPVLVGPA